MKTKQKASARRGYVNAKHNTEGAKVKAMKSASSAAYASAKNKIDTSTTVAGKAKGLYDYWKNGPSAKASRKASASHSNMRRVRYGDNLTSSGVEKKRKK